MIGMYAAPAPSHTFTWGPGPIGASIAWLGRKVQPLGYQHTWTHTRFMPVPVQPAPAPAPVAYYPPMQAQQYMLTLMPTATPQAAPTHYYATQTAPPAGSMPPAPMIRGEEAPPPPRAAPKPGKTTGLELPPIDATEIPPPPHASRTEKDPLVRLSAWFAAHPQ